MLDIACEILVRVARRRRGTQAAKHTDTAVQAAWIQRGGTVNAAIISRSGTLGAAKLGAAATVLVALIAGSCTVMNTGVQGHYSVEAAKATNPPTQAELARTTKKDRVMKNMVQVIQHRRTVLAESAGTPQEEFARNDLLAATIMFATVASTDVN
ncbi:hypothetical protein AB0M54_47730 [Actinoplanes sp. NPDC051470]|uniref:hypothetical protein n=1 Tax=Actinoplanes sp. NPDC051470 TaxID=3157224 RepID=UPI0034414598